MTNTDTENYKKLEYLVAQSGYTYGFDGETSVICSMALLEVIKDMGLNPMNTDEFRRGLISLFNIEIINMPDLDNNRFILTPNHVSDFDAIILGLFHPKIRIVSKNDWTNNEKLKTFLAAHYNLYGLDRMSLQSLRGLLTDAVNYFKDTEESRHYLLFSQGTISDFNNNSVERISSVAKKISDMTDVPVVNIFFEQVSLYHPTRIVFDNPMKISPGDDFREVWIEREKAMQKSLNPTARFPKLSEKHANNNKPGDPFFSKFMNVK